MDLLRVARKIVRECVGLRKNEKVLVITDPPRARIGTALFEAAAKTGGKPLLVLIPVMKRHGQEPPAHVARLMREFDVVLAPTTFSITHTRARAEACMAGARVITMPGITEEMMVGGAMLADYRKIRRRVSKMVKVLDSGSEVRIVGSGNTELEFSIAGRTAHADTGIVHEPGDFGNLPAGEAFIAPVEGTATGSVVVDGSLGGICKQPVVLVFKNGRVRQIRGSAKLASVLKKAGEKASQLAEFGMGANPNARLGVGILESEKALGTCHIALGDNSTFGGKIEAGIHLDGVLKRPTVEIDGRLVMERGRLLI
jgi:leucyl aminopeptidase (aminopeptidase T)